MSTDLAIRRTIRKVAHADFAVYKVWEWALGEAEGLGYEEAFVRPTPHEAIPGAADGHYIVLASVTLSEGSVLPGCIEVTRRGAKLQCDPMFILLQDRHLDFLGAETMRVLSHYTKTAGAHPLSWTLDVPVEGEALPRSGKIRRGLFAWLSQLGGRGKGLGPAGGTV